MNDDPLQHLLQAAEPPQVEPPRSFAPDGLLAAARRRRVRRRATRTAAAASIVVLLAASLLTSDESLKPPASVRRTTAMIAQAPPTPHVPAPAVEFDSLQHELARLEREAAMHEQIIAAVLAPEPPNEAPQPLGLSDAELVRLETARSAALSLQYARIAERELHDLETARREYQRVVERFPGTEWSQLAAASLQRLAELRIPPST